MLTLKRSKLGVLVALALVAMIAVVGCTGKGSDEQKQAADGGKLTGEIKIDGSSTVFPISEAVGEEFQIQNPEVRVKVGVSGTGGGFKKFAAGEIDISDASRPIKDKEKTLVQQNKIDYIELPVAYDGISIVVNKNNNWVDKLTVEELKKIWEPDSKVTKWSQVRSQWPDKEIKLYGPGTDSGTFDYFTDVVNGKEGASRSDYTASEDDNMLVQGISGDKYSLGYFGYAYYAENKDKLKIVPIDDGSGKAVEPNEQTILDGSYKPLSRPVFIYVNKASLAKEQVSEFVKYYLTEGPVLIPDVGYVPLPAEKYNEGLSAIGVK